MDVQDLSRVTRFKPVHTSPTIACCNCGNAMVSNGFSMCNDCIAVTVDLTQDIQKSAVITFCKNCERLLVPPDYWIHAPRESRELLASLLKRLKGLNKLRLIDARFIWTEPHSRRTKIKLKVEGEAKQFANTKIQQDVVVEFTETTAMCRDCAKSYTASTWRACLQIRQKVDHKKTFLYLEQLILKSKQHKNTVSIQESKHGLDFFYNQQNHALRMLDFLNGVIPARTRKSSELISENIQNSTKEFKFTYSVDIVPICRDDLVVLPKKVSKTLGGGISQLTLCYKIGNSVHLMDTLTLQTTEISPINYWRSPFPALTSVKDLKEFMVLDIEPVGVVAKNKYVLADATVAKTSDLGRNDTTYYVRTHLGGILHAGDYVLGYDLVSTNFNSDLWDELNEDRVPEVILVKKSYPDKTRNRNWKLKRMAKEYNEEQSGAGSGGGRHDAFERAQRDYEEFLKEIEYDEELRHEINLYRVKDSQVPGDGESGGEYEGEDAEGDDYDDDDVPVIKMEELKLDSESELEEEDEFDSELDE